MKKLIPLLPVILLVFVSGCTIEDINPFDGGNNKGSVNDIIVIREGLKAIPREIKPNQSTDISVPIFSNLPVEETQIISVDVKITDWCDPFLELKKAVCEGQDKEPSGNIDEFGCENISLGPQSTKFVKFSLKASNLTYSCPVKIELDYPFSSNSITILNFIDFKEMRRLLATGGLNKEASKIEKGQGPVNIYFEITPDQPILTGDETEFKPIAKLKVDNIGSGSIVDDKIIIRSIEPADVLRCRDDKGNLIEDGTELSLENTKVFSCDVRVPSHEDVGTKSTSIIILRYSYKYKLKKSVDVEVVKKT